MRTRIPKTLKMYVGGRFIRSESGRVLAATSHTGDAMYVCTASRKDLKNAIQTARGATRSWAGKTAYNRGQILYRLAEMIDDRATVLTCSDEDAGQAADRAVHHAGWTDKLGAILAAVNPVATGHINYAHLRPTGIVVACPNAAHGLTGLVEATCAALVPGNTVIVLVPSAMAELATQFAEMLATSDVPSGVVNVLTGDVADVLQWADKHDDVDIIYVAEGALTELRVNETRAAAARVMRRIVEVDGAVAADALTLQAMSEVQTVWISSSKGGAGEQAY